MTGINVEKWYAEEFSGVSLGDKRLDKRLVKVSESILSRPQDSIQQACGSWAEAKAAYRLFDNDNLQSKKLLESHHTNLKSRFLGHPVILSVQDTCYFNFNPDTQIDGVGVICKRRFSNIQGIVMHCALAMLPSGVPLGLIDQQIYAREPKSKRKHHYEHLSIPIEKKESFRWIKSLRAAAKFSSSETDIVTVADRESDIYEFILDAFESGQLFVIRAAKNRAILNGYCNDGDYDHLWDFILRGEKRASFNLSLKAQNGRPERVAKVELRFDELTLRPAIRRTTAKVRKLPPVDVTAISLKEVNAPKGVEPVEWMLLTNTVVENIEEAIEKISWYKTRWQIECYHKVLKSGFKIESCRLRSFDRLEKFICLTSILAVRVFALTHLSRQYPSSSCEIILSQTEWKALYWRMKKTKSLPQSPPSIAEAVTWIAALGGFLGRKNDGPPGATFIWRGWQRLDDIVEDYCLFQKIMGNS